MCYLYNCMLAGATVINLRSLIGKLIVKKGTTLQQDLNFFQSNSNIPTFHAFKIAVKRITLK